MRLLTRWLASAKMQRWALRLPVSNRIANARARALFDLCAGFVYSQVLLACVQTRVLERLYAHPRTSDALSAELGLEPPAVERLLRAAAALRLVKPDRLGRYHVGALGAPLIANPGLCRMIEHHALVYRDLADPVALLGAQSPETELARYWPYALSRDPRAVEAAGVGSYTALMAASQNLIAFNVLDSYSLRKHRALLDVGGGDGTFLMQAAAANPRLELMLFELPAVAELAANNMGRLIEGGRARIFEGDFLRESLPAGADLISLVRIVHDHDDEAALTLLRAAKAALPPGGTLLIAEPLAGSSKAGRVGDAYFGFYLLAMGQGRARTHSELKALLRRAGFDRIRQVRTRQPLAGGLILARVRG